LTVSPSNIRLEDIESIYASGGSLGTSSTGVSTGRQAGIASRIIIKGDSRFFTYAPPALTCSYYNYNTISRSITISYTYDAHIPYFLITNYYISPVSKCDLL
jgi:hypothetical protein